MPDYSELIFSDDFKEYRKQQLTEIVKHVSSIIQGGIYSEVRAHAELKGALDLAMRIIRLPAKLVNNEKYAEQLDKTIREDLVNISTFLVREYLKEND